MNLAKRIGALERKVGPKRKRHLAVRFVNGGPGIPQQPVSELEDDDDVLVVEFVEARDGRPVRPTRVGDGMAMLPQMNADRCR